MSRGYYEEATRKLLPWHSCDGKKRAGKKGRKCKRKERGYKNATVAYNSKFQFDHYTV